VQVLVLDARPLCVRVKSRWQLFVVGDTLRTKDVPAENATSVQKIAIQGFCVVRG